ncbi:MAG TPA: flavodoxin domain-containing protein [Jatrophihabitantaceae bacterium]|jgi:hypothetical protein|nr:flavodoxin domain-containing protein [Jatrophihabitantaceae bacterium]
MRATVIYESMYGNTRKIAEAIAEGLDGTELDLVPVGVAIEDRPASAEIVVIGAPTHMLGMSRPGSRTMAVAAAAKPNSGVVVEPGAAGPGVREWLAHCVGRGRYAVAFDTSLRGRWSGGASRPIAKLLRKHGFVVLAEPESFFVSKDNVLEPGEIERAREWGRLLARQALGPRRVGIYAPP